MAESSIQSEDIKDFSLFAQAGSTYSVSSLVESPLRIDSLELSCNFEKSGLVSYELNRNHSFLNQSETPNNDLLTHQKITSGQFATRLTQITGQATLLDRPLVLSLQQPLRLEPRGALSVCLSRPIAVELTAHSDGIGSLVLCSAPIKPLRTTSYGLVSQPMLCYHWETPIVTTPVDGNEALVPLMINNQTKQAIELRKITLYKGYLKLYRSSEGYQTNLVQVQITSDHEAYLEYDEGPPLSKSALELIYESPSAAPSKILKLLRLASKRSTGIEYGF